MAAYVSKKNHKNVRSLSEFNKEANSLVKRVQETRQPLVLTEQSHDVAVVLEANVFEAMQERLQLLEDIHRAERQLEAGKGVPHDEAKVQVS